MAIAWQTSAAGAARVKGAGNWGEGSMGQGVRVAWLSACQRLRRVTVVVRVRLTFRYADRQNGTALLPRSPLPSTPLLSSPFSSFLSSPPLLTPLLVSGIQWARHSFGCSIRFAIFYVTAANTPTRSRPPPFSLLSLSPILPAPCRTSILSVQQPVAIDSLKLCNFFYFARAN